MPSNRTVLLALLLAACDGKRATPTTLPASAASPAPGAPTSASALVMTAEVASAGLRVETGTLAATGGVVGASWGYSDLLVDLGSARLEIEPAPGGALLPALLPKGALAVVNGGYFEPDFRPSTWLKNANQELAPKSDTTKGGVFALKPGVTYLGSFAGLSFEPELAIQSFPLLVEPDFKHGIHKDDGRRAARTVVCLMGDALHLIVLAAPRGEGPTLFEAATLLRAARPNGFGCRIALNLDGGPSTGVIFGPRVAAKSRVPLAKVGYGLAILPSETPLPPR